MYFGTDEYGKNYDVRSFLLHPTVLDLRLLFRELFVAGPYLLSLSQAKLSANTPRRPKVTAHTPQEDAKRAPSQSPPPPPTKLPTIVYICDVVENLQNWALGRPSDHPFGRPRFGSRARVILCIPKMPCALILPCGLRGCRPRP